MKFIALFSCLLFSWKVFACPPSAAEMSRLYQEYLVKSEETQEIRLAFFPFQDGSVSEMDPTLQDAFPIALYNFFTSVEKVGDLHPFAVMNVLAAQPLSNSDLFDESRIIAVASTVKATHAVIGMFQKQGDQLRYFIKVVDVSNGKVIDTVKEFQAQLSDRFFSAMGDTAEEIGKTLGVKFPKSQIRTTELATPTFEAFRYYVKGMQKSRTYNEVDLGIAKVWFEKSSTISYDYKPALEDLIRVLAMQGLWNKQMGKDSSIIWAEAETVNQRLGATPMAADKNKKGVITLPAGYKRWLRANQLFIEGIGNAQSNQVGPAVSSFEQLVQLTPEDGVAHKILGDIYSKIGNGKASQEQALAGQIGSCVQ